MQVSKINKSRILLFLPLALLHLQFGVILLHHHHCNSWYDHKDPIHHICANIPTQAKLGVTPITPGSPSYNPVLPATVIHVVAPNRLAVGHIRPTPSDVAIYRPTTSFPNRASPA